MSKPVTITLNKNEKVLAVIPEFASGPGWSNRLVTVHILDYANNSYRTVYLQFDEVTPEMHTLFSIGAEVHNKLIGAVPTKNSGKSV